jgi:8-oxo-dGTP diphosphatase
MKLVTLLFLMKDNQILLAMKKRGFGVGKWNGVGGKADPGEDEYQAAIRECQEEIGVTPIDPKLVGKIKFYDKADASFGHYAHIFVTDKWEGEPTETEEMKPQWYNLADIPYDQMWADDIHWLPLVLEGNLFEATITTDGDKLYSYDIRPVTKLS